MKKIAAIWAEDENQLIGRNQTLPWHLPAELKHFKETTIGHTIVMGRVTFDGMNQRALPKRTTIVLTHDKSYQVDNQNVLIFHSVQDILDWYDKQDKNLYIIGGAQIFAAFADYYDELVKTVVHAKLEGDTYLKDVIDLSAYRRIKAVDHQKDEQNPYDFTINTWVKK